MGCFGLLWRFGIIKHLSVLDETTIVHQLKTNFGSLPYLIYCHLQQFGLVRYQ